MKHLQSSAKRASNIAIFIRLSKLFKPHWKLIVLGIFLSIVTVISSVGLIALSGWFLASMAVAGVAKVSMNYFTPSGGIRMLALTRAFGRYTERLVNHYTTLEILADLRYWLYGKIEPLVPAVLQKYHSGDIFSRIKADIDTLENLYVRIIVPTITAFITGSLFVYFISLYDKKLAVIEAFGLLLAGFILPAILLVLSYKTGKETIQVMAKLREYSVDSIQGLGELMIYGATNKQSKKIEELSVNLSNMQHKMSVYNAFAQASLMAIVGICVVLVTLVAVPIIRDAQMPAVNIAMLTLFVMASFEAVVGMSQVFRLLPETIAAGRRVFEIVDSEASIVEPASPSKKIDNFDIVFDKVCFSYDDTELLSDLTFKLKEGENIAIVGRSGVGKSTIVNLMTRFYAHDKGEITIGGLQIEKFQSESLREYISVATQQNQIFNKTIRENLLIAKADASQEELDEVCKVAQIYDFIKTLPEGFDTWMDELGHNFSGGQKRRLIVARALLKPAKILILDEPGEGIDRETEKKMLRAIFEYKKSTSIILISHSKIKGVEQLLLHIASKRG